MTRTVSLISRGQEIGRVVWDGQTVTVQGSPVLKDDLEQGVSVGGIEMYPSDGEAFLDAVLEVYGGSYLEAVEAP